MEEKKITTSHRLLLDNRARGTITGVLDVEDFDAEKIQAQTEAGKLLIKGENLHITSLNLEKGELELEGKVDSLIYTAKGAMKKEESLLKRMFR